MHSRGFVHCDVKPQNILLRDNGTPILLDFGIARTEGTAPTTLIATPHYLAPERAKGAAPAAASDLYALGIVLYQTVAGSPPFDAPDVHAIIQQHINLTVPALKGIDPLLPVLDRIIARLTAKQPDDRYPSAQAVQEDLTAVERNLPHAQPTVAISPQSSSQTPAAALSGSAISLPRPAIALPQLAAARATWSAARATWSAAPSWRRRRWLALAIVPVILLLLGFSLARARRADSEPPALQPSPVLEPAASTTQIPVIDVPDVTGLQYTAASQVLAQRGLVAQLGDERINTVAPGIVLEMHPAATTPLPAGDVVTLHISAGAGTVAEPAPPVEQVAPPAVEQEVPPAVEQRNNNARGKDKDNDRDKGKDRDQDEDDD
jgi:hypothetical protein